MKDKWWWKECLERMLDSTLAKQVWKSKLIDLWADPGRDGRRIFEGVTGSLWRDVKMMKNCEDKWGEKNILKNK